jgi:hypothetical protein
MRILVAALLIVGAHFSLTALVPGPRALFYWPFGPESKPIVGFGAGALTRLLSVIAGACLLAAAAALFGLIIPEAWFLMLALLMGRLRLSGNLRLFPRMGSLFSVDAQN